VYLYIDVRKQGAEFLQKQGCALAFGHVEVDERCDFDGQADVGGEKQDGNFGFDLPHSGCDLAAVHSGHGVVEDDGVNWLLGKDFETGGAVEGGENAVAGTFQKNLSDLKADLFVIDAKDEMGFLLHKRVGDVSRRLPPGITLEYTKVFVCW
jgi:hypothetical protein